MIINANQSSGNFWFRADAENACISFNNGVGRSIFTYSGTTVANPVSQTRVQAVYLLHAALCCEAVSQDLC